MHTEFWWENLRKGDQSEYLGVWEDNIKMDLRKVGRGTWIGSIGLL